jgi:hypothetical protein
MFDGQDMTQESKRARKATSKEVLSLFVLPGLKIHRLGASYLLNSFTGGASPLGVLIAILSILSFTFLAIAFMAIRHDAMLITLDKHFVRIPGLKMAPRLPGDSHKTG